MVDDHKITDALENVTSATSFSASAQIQKLLHYVVTEELAGRGDRLKAYTIAVDALGRPDTFDPQSDPLVRVQAGRLRLMLAAYYADEGKDAAVRIVLPKGAYRPSFDFMPSEPLDEAKPGSIAAQGHMLQSRWRLVAMIVAACGLVAFGAFIQYWRHDDDTPGLTWTASDNLPPIVEVMPFSVPPDVDSNELAEGIRLQLVSDLSHFRSIRVRPVSKGDEGVDRTNGNLRPADYRINGRVIGPANALSLTVTTTNVANGILLSSHTAVVPANDAQFYNLLSQTIRSIVIKLGTTSGVIQTASMKWLNERRSKLGNENASSYECVLLFHVYDLNKRPKDEVAARMCLKRLTSEGSQDSSIWASWSFMQFLDWTKQADQSDRTLMDEALVSARRAIRLDPANAAGHEYLGSILMAKGAHEDALAAYQRAIGLNPSKPDIHVLFGWHNVLNGKWDEGIAAITEGVNMSPAASGWMRIPLSINEFRLGNYQRALSEAQAIIQTGDQRGVVLALAAAMQLEEEQLTTKYLAIFKASESLDVEDPMKEVRSVFDSPEILDKYKAVLLDGGLR